MDKPKEKSWHWPIYPRHDGKLEYACEHGVGHSREINSVHGCDGCCKDPNFPKG